MGNGSRKQDRKHGLRGRLYVVRPLQPGWPHLQSTSGVFSMASHCGLQYFFPSDTLQLQLGCAHFLLSATADSFLLGRSSFRGRRMRLKGFGEKLDHGFVEGRNVVGFAAADPVFVANYFLVAPTGPGIAYVV